jgi:2-methylisocitrate lyase-like PEP mutase family enzyme
MHQSSRMRELLANGQPLLSVGVYDCFSAKIGEHAGFPVLSISGNALTASLLGLPDLGLITMTEVVNQAHNIANSVEVPVLADGDTGYGNALNAMRAIREFEAAGIAGLSLEDQVFPNAGPMILSLSDERIPVRLRGSTGLSSVRCGIAKQAST